MVELMVVVAILALLAGLLLPTLARLKVRAAVLATQNEISLLERGCELFFNEKKMYPASSDATLTGAQMLAAQLLQPKYAAQFELSNQPTVNRPAKSGATQYSVFLDRFPPSQSHAIVYYRYDETAQPDKRYAETDNPDKLSGNVSNPDAIRDKNSAIIPVNTYAASAVNNNVPVYYRTNYILISAGPDGRFDAPAVNPATDDITNFLRQ